MLNRYTENTGSADPVFFLSPVYYYQSDIEGIPGHGDENLKDNIRTRGFRAMNVDAGLDAAISVFIRNPELSSIQYKASKNLIAMEMILKGNIDCQQQQAFCQKTLAALKLFRKLRGIENTSLRINFDNRGNISVLSLFHDVLSLAEEEIDLYVRLVEVEFSTLLLRESNEVVLQDSSFNDLKMSLLQKINKPGHTYKNIFAYRDRGRMFVYDK